MPASSPSSCASPVEAAVVPPRSLTMRPEEKHMQQLNQSEQTQNFNALKRKHQQQVPVVPTNESPPVGATVPRTQGGSRSHANRHYPGRYRRHSGAKLEPNRQQRSAGVSQKEHAQLQHQTKQSDEMDSPFQADTATPTSSSGPEKLGGSGPSRLSQAPRAVASTSLPHPHLQQQQHAKSACRHPVDGQLVDSIPVCPQSQEENETSRDEMERTHFTPKNPPEQNWNDGQPKVHPDQSQQRSKERTQDQRTLLERVLRAVMGLIILLFQQAQELAAVCLWQMIRAILGLCKQLCCRCSVGLYAAAEGLGSRVRTGQGTTSIILGVIVKLLQQAGELLNRGAVAAAAAASRARDETRASRAAAIGTAVALGSKWNAMKTGRQTASDKTEASEDLGSADCYQSNDGSLELSPEEALATACDLWASLHRESPWRRVGVLEFQEELRQRLTAKNGLLHLLPEANESDDEVVQNQADTETQFQKQPVRNQQINGTPVAQKGILKRSTQYIPYACRLALISSGVLISVLLLPFQHRQQHQSQQRLNKKRKQAEPTPKSFISKLATSALIFIKVLLQELRGVYAFVISSTERAAGCIGSILMWTFHQVSCAINSVYSFALPNGAKRVLNVPIDTATSIISSSFVVLKRAWR